MARQTNDHRSADWKVVPFEGDTFEFLVHLFTGRPYDWHAVRVNIRTINEQRPSALPMNDLEKESQLWALRCRREPSSKQWTMPHAFGRSAFFGG